MLWNWIECHTRTVTLFDTELKLKLCTPEYKSETTSESEFEITYEDESETTSESEPESQYEIWNLKRETESKPENTSESGTSSESET